MVATADLLRFFKKKTRGRAGPHSDEIVCVAESAMVCLGLTLDRRSPCHEKEGGYAANRCCSSPGKQSESDFKRPLRSVVVGGLGGADNVRILYLKKAKERREEQKTEEPNSTAEHIRHPLTSPSRESV